MVWRQYFCRMDSACLLLMLKIILCRAILKQPQLIILEDALDQFSDSETKRIIDYLCEPTQPWAMVIVSSNTYWNAHATQTITLDKSNFLKNTMLNISESSLDEIKLNTYKSGSKVYKKSFYKTFNKLSLSFLIIGLSFLFLPWTQNINEFGYVTTLRPEQRPQTIQSPIPGRIEAWYVPKRYQKRRYYFKNF